jgi:hypothetical protein
VLRFPDVELGMRKLTCRLQNTYADCWPAA